MAQVLRQLTPEISENLLVGTETFDDAGIFRLSAELALVQTLDFFPPLVNDPYQFGRIAAANALSDVYAMGGEPLTAMNIVGFPDKELDPDVLVAILRGGADAVHQAGAVTVGGHSVRDVEVKYGLSVTGRVHPARILRNSGARPGDVLILTKPLGSGVLTTAAKNEMMPESELCEAVVVMSALNRPGRDAAVQIGVNACTDVTGYGLIGHAFEMAEGSNVTVSIQSAAVPLMNRTLEFARRGALTRTHKATREHLGEKLLVEGDVQPALAGVLADAQTSGGLLLSVPEDRAAALQMELQRCGAISHAIVGRVEAAGRYRIRVVA